ncbi:MAG: PIN domain-containing protein [Geobacter sp.]|jgi:predicted nucleic-acid-binding protein|uniref:PIN domain-containing protein n=1 Tax=Trichlorobacter sp. TaxID=2911007 RepID=UPI002A37055F|nr:PIN domain-containing protein [Trichlorobacter sp.]MDY0384827.1 PIN domain-containing protein [Trichlorobacter sp.]
MKKPVALPDTNYILRYLLRDDAKQFLETNAFFEQVRTGKERALVLESVITECLYVLTKHYQVPRAAAAESLLGMLTYKGISNPDRDRLASALGIFMKTTLDPVDCLLAATVRQGQHRLMTFDKALVKQCQKEV